MLFELRTGNKTTVTLTIVILSIVTACEPIRIPPDAKGFTPSPPLRLASPIAPAASTAPFESPSPFPSPATASPIVATSTAVILVGPNQSGQVIQVLVGQIIQVANPGLSAEWQVDFAPEVLTALTPADQLRTPGPNGWRFQALAPGQTDLALTSIPKSCSTRTPCAPAVARFVFTIRVSK